MSETFPINETDLVNPSLFELYRDQEVTIRGVTGKMGDLIKLCPVPESEMSPQSKEEWTANILIESGVDIPDENVSETTKEYIANTKEDLAKKK